MTLFGREGVWATPPPPIPPTMKRSTENAKMHCIGRGLAAAEAAMLTRQDSCAATRNPQPPRTSNSVPNPLCGKRQSPATKPPLRIDLHTRAWHCFYSTASLVTCGPSTAPLSPRTPPRGLTGSVLNSAAAAVTAPPPLVRAWESLVTRGTHWDQFYKPSGVLGTAH